MRFEDLEASFVEVVEVGMSHHDEVDQRHEFKSEAGSSLPFDDSVPVCPIGIDDHRVIRELDKKGCVPNPSDTNFPSFGWVGDRLSAGAVAFLENLRKQAVAKEMVIPAWPALLG